jgi:hypothetical protein
MTRFHEATLSLPGTTAANKIEAAADARRIPSHPFSGDTLDKPNVTAVNPRVIVK